MLVQPLYLLKNLANHSHFRQFRLMRIGTTDVDGNIGYRQVPHSRETEDEIFDGRITDNGGIVRFGDVHRNWQTVSGLLKPFGNDSRTLAVQAQIIDDGTIGWQSE